MKILVVGGGGREHAIIKKIKENKSVEKIFALPGNGGIALDAEDHIIGYQFVSLGKMTDFIKKGDDPNTAWEKAKGQYGRVADAVKIIDPRHE